MKICVAIKAVHPRKRARRGQAAGPNEDQGKQGSSHGEADKDDSDKDIDDSSSSSSSTTTSNKEDDASKPDGDGPEDPDQVDASGDDDAPMPGNFERDGSHDSVK